MRKACYPLFILCLSTPASLCAEEAGADFNLQTIIDTSNQIASESRLNIDYTPSTLSVLHREELKLLGVNTLFEALSLLPGIETSVTHFGVKRVVPRGLNNPNNFVADKMKLIIDGTTIQTDSIGNSSYYLDLPVDLIERIEVLRGPGSALYGTGAFSGVISVHTTMGNPKETALFAGGGNDSYVLGGARFSGNLSEKMRLHLNAYAQKGDRRIPVDRRFGSHYNTVNPSDGSRFVFPRDFESNEALNDKMFAASLEYRNWFVKGSFKQNSQGNYFGWDEFLEYTTDKRTENRYAYVEAGYDSQSLSWGSWYAKVGYSHYRANTDAENYYYREEENIYIPYEFSIDNSEQAFYTTGELRYTALEGHTLVGTVEYRYSDLIASNVNDTLTGLGERTMIDPDAYRELLAVGLQDTLSLLENLYVLGALRYDYYTKYHKGYPSAQLGLVYMPTGAVQIKFNYGHAFRLPSWTETDSLPGNQGVRPGNPDLEAETADTFELQLHTTPFTDHDLGVTFYYSYIQDTIDIEDISGRGSYDNRPGQQSKGIEASYQYKAPGGDQMMLAASYNLTDYTTPGEQIKLDMPSTAKWLAKGYYIHFLSPALSLSGLLKYVGPRTGNEELYNSYAGSDDLDAYTTFDTTLMYQCRHMQFSASIKNLFDAAVKESSYYARHDGIPREGRNFLVKYELTF